MTIDDNLILAIALSYVVIYRLDILMECILTGNAASAFAIATVIEQDDITKTSWGYDPGITVWVDLRSTGQ